MGGKEFTEEVSRAAGYGAVAASGLKVIDTACQTVAEGLAISASCARNVVPIGGAAFGVCNAGYNIYTACHENDPKNEKKKEAVASSVEAVCGVAATVAVTALECSGPVGWTILVTGVLLGWATRSFA